MNPYSGELAHIRVNDFLREAERITLASKALRERKTIRRERVATATLRRPVRQAWVLASAALAILRS
ncbi:MAG: hypothetical protein E6J01_13090 [Chloroflexi bacterium]|jgi:hypothetical protein|nr:MAG: hypothetical protein E6J01_13090 [Chloroflexota bacterium]